MFFHFGLVSAGGSLGGLFTSLIIGLFAESVDIATLLLLPVLVLKIGLFCFRRLQTAAEKMTSGESPANRLAPQQGPGNGSWPDEQSVGCNSVQAGIGTDRLVLGTRQVRLARKNSG